MNETQRTQLLLDLHHMQQSYGTMFSALSKVQAKGDECLEPLTSRQYMALVAVLHLPEDETTLINIAGKMATSKQTANKLISGLKKRGYISVKHRRTDHRSINVVITDAGNAALITCSEKFTYFLSDLFHEFTSEELELFWRLFKKLYRFDGVEQDGFEADAGFDAGAAQTEIEARILVELAKRRP